MIKKWLPAPFKRPAGAGRITDREGGLPVATGRPDEVLEALDISPHNAQVHRTDLILQTEKE